MNDVKLAVLGGEGTGKSGEWWCFLWCRGQKRERNTCIHIKLDLTIYVYYFSLVVFILLTSNAINCICRIYRQLEEDNCLKY